MPRLSQNIAAAFAAILITLVSVQTVVTVPTSSLASVSIPHLA